MSRLYVTEPNYTTPASFYVRKDSGSITSTSWAAHMGACSGCTWSSTFAAP